MVGATKSEEGQTDLAKTPPRPNLAPVLSQLSGYNQTVTYDKLGNVRRIVEKIGAKDRVSLGTKVWQTSYSSACAVGLGDDQVSDQTVCRPNRCCLFCEESCCQTCSALQSR